MGQAWLGNLPIVAEIVTYPIRGTAFAHSVTVTEVLADVRSPFQRIEFVQTEAFGRMLLLDGHIQLTERDEAAYHEALVQVPALNLAKRERALVIGAGDGAVVRELLKAGFGRVVMAEIDQDVIAASQMAWPELSAGAFQDERLELHLGDAFPFVKGLSETFDLIVVDSTDIYEEEEGELSEQLFTEGFYRDLERLLEPEGVLVTQADNPVFCPYSLEAVLATFGAVFGASGSYWSLVPSFGGYSAFAWGSKGRGLARRWADLSVEKRAFGYLTPVRYDLGMSELPFLG